MNIATGQKCNKTVFYQINIRRFALNLDSCSAPVLGSEAGCDRHHWVHATARIWL